MKGQVLNLLSRVVDLLIDCGWQDKANWYSELRNELHLAKPGSDEFNAHLRRLDRSLSGMGSFSDLPLESKSGRMSDQETRSLQWELAERMGDAIERMVDTPCPKEGSRAD